MKRAVVASLLALMLGGAACSSAGPNVPIQPVGPTVTSSVPTEYVPTAIPITPTFEGCAYVWGSEDLPELSRLLNSKLQAIGPDVTGLAYAYGENCVYADGHQTFSAMETDYRVGIQVTTVKDEGTLGDWIFKVMPIVLALPEDQVQGPQPGRVDFDFKQPDPAELFVSVPIDKYRREAGRLRGAELLHLFYTNP